jgi:hypothetical protein
MFGKRVDGDEYLQLIHRVTPFFSQPSNQSWHMEYHGGDDVTQITYVTIQFKGSVSS